MVKDIITGITNTEIGFITDVNGIAYFTVNDETTVGKELWKSYGTANGTVLLKDIMPGVNSSEPSILINMNGTLFFTAIGEGSGRGMFLNRI
ncbi:hypothetical protein [Emticicia agri]|uniref:Uncharacterized protein n=1 Tax=Emticicia agri TaxID=2492393 RepID=A0A4Q5LUL2_9BACT|nr:hypothetical protein [Emticicia agri]RYU93368.1 hypothetical protein EWM59_22160 [Emticicia agri]